MKLNFKKATVEYNGKCVGYLAELSDGIIGFEYDETWQKNGFSISLLSLPLKSGVFTSKKPYFEGLFGVFWDCLPDGWGELLIRRSLRKRGVDYSNLSPITKLLLVNNSGLGGLEFKPSQAERFDGTSADLDELSLSIAELINNEDSDFDLDRIYGLGGSSGGARPKAHLKIDGEDWIVKFGCRIDPKDVGLKEYNANLTAKDCNINVNEFKLFSSKLSTGYFGAKRFDRVGERRVHVVSLSGLLETTHRIPNLDYSHLFQVIERISADKSNDLIEAYKRMCFNVYYKNKDDHGKNFAFLYDETLKGYTLTPFYDITYTPDKFEHEMTVCGNGNPTDAELIQISKRFNLSQTLCADIRESIKKIIQ
ncbi:MAG: type II toxin-antitoxin system HipA family toxin [Clostridia bacterium]|nr:type II toxin-antitoxin system HipA family toxin [Clostridia bacterium]